MKYLYQQLIAFWTLIIVVILIIGLSFTQLTRNSMEESNYEQLLGYGQSVTNTTKLMDDSLSKLGFTTDQKLFYVLNMTKSILGPENVDLLFLNANQKIVYPEGSTSTVTLTNHEWEKIKSGQVIRKTLSVNVYGEREPTSYVFYSASIDNASGNKEFYGTLVITQPARNLEKTMSSLTSNLVKGFIVSAVIALIISYYLAKFQVKRINSMKEATRQIAEGNFDVQLTNRNKDEFDELAQDFNQMAGSLKESNEEIKRQEERRKQFMADASHEMRTPLTTIKGLLEGLQYHAIPENQRENAIRLMQNETERLIRLVNENLDYEKIRTNQINIVIKKFNATETFRNLITQLETKSESANDKLILQTTEDIDVFADYDRFVQIMVNIIQNAIQFTKDGTITISLEKGNLETIIKISDTGIGMDEEQVKNIWERYYKVDPSRKNTKYGESGLGLAIVQQLVRLHKGRIAVESKLGEGTTFTIAFPDVEIPDEQPKDSGISTSEVESESKPAAQEVSKGKNTSDVKAEESVVEDLEQSEVEESSEPNQVSDEDSLESPKENTTQEKAEKTQENRSTPESEEKE